MQTELFCRKPYETFVIDVYSEWIETGYEDIYPEVEFDAVYKQRVLYVVRNYHAVHVLIDYQR